MLHTIHWPDLLLHAIWAVFGLLVGYTWNQFNAWRKGRGQGALLAGLDGPHLFVFPLRPAAKPTPLPRMAIEDFLAINNIISAYIRAGRPPPDKIRDTTQLTDHDKRENNLLLICSSKSNEVTKEALDRLRARSPKLAPLIPCFEDVPGAYGKRIQLRWAGGVYPSDSYDQEARGSARLDDIAVIVKAQNPWAAQHKVLILAGIRGFGTWGAAEFMKKWWKELYDAKRQSRRRGMTKQGDYVAVVSVHYEDHDIKSVSLLHMVDLEPAYL